MINAKRIMKRVLIIAAVTLFLAVALGSCKTSKCPAYTKNTSNQTEQIKV